MSVRTLDVVVVVPAYNEGSVIAETITGLRATYPNVVCVNDGSTDDTGSQALSAGATVLTHVLNLGQGAALATGIGYALTSPAFADCQILVTFDSDGQHDPADIGALIVPLASGSIDVALGSRFLGRAEGIGTGKRMLLKAAVAFTRLTTRLRLTDTHNGLRAFTRAAAEQVSITQHGMAHASEILHEIHRHGLRYVEVPITIRYTNYSKAKGQSALNAVNIVFDMLLRERRSG